MIVDHVQWYNIATGCAHVHPCIHGDLTQVVPQGSFDQKADFETRAAQIDHADLCADQWCFAHGQNCPIFRKGCGVAEPDYDISGLPCPDHSRAGNRAYEQGATSSVFACHAKMHVHYQTPLLCIENVWDSVVENFQNNISKDF